MIFALAFFAGTKVDATDVKDKAFPSAEKHQITLNDALKMVGDFRKNPQAPQTQGSTFDRSAFDKILAQPGCKGIKMYWAKENGRFTVVLVGVNATGKDMTTMSIMEMSAPCPPWCDINSPFTIETIALAK